MNYLSISASGSPELIEELSLISFLDVALVLAVINLVCGWFVDHWAYLESTDLARSNLIDGGLLLKVLDAPNEYLAQAYRRSASVSEEFWYQPKLRRGGLAERINVLVLSYHVLCKDSGLRRFTESIVWFNAVTATLAVAGIVTLMLADHRRPLLLLGDYHPLQLIVCAGMCALGLLGAATLAGKAALVDMLDEQLLNRYQLDEQPATAADGDNGWG